MSIQSVYSLYQGRGWPGQVSRPGTPVFFETVKIGGSAEVRPGYGLFYDRTNSDFRKPGSIANQLEVMGIASYDTGAIQSTFSTRPSGLNSDQYITYDAGDVIRMGICGHFWATAGSAIQYGDALFFDREDNEWKLLQPGAGDVPTPSPSTAGSPTNAELEEAIQDALDAQPKITARCASASAADGELFEIFLSGAVNR